MIAILSSHQAKMGHHYEHSSSLQREQRSSVGKCLARFFQVQASVSLRASAQASVSVQN